MLISASNTLQLSNTVNLNNLSHVLKTLRRKTFENFMGNGKIADDPAFPTFPTMFQESVVVICTKVVTML